MGTAALLGALGFASIVAAACDSGTSAPQGLDEVTDDTRDASTPRGQNPDDGAAPMGEPDALYGEDGAYGPDSSGITYPGVAECSACSCPSATSYCFGGATSRTTQVHVVPQATDAAPPPCPKVAAGTLGCTALPSGATTCAEIISQLQPAYSCYLVCAFDGTTMSVYCPSY